MTTTLEDCRNQLVDLRKLAGMPLTSSMDWLIRRVESLEHELANKATLVALPGGSLYEEWRQRATKAEERLADLERRFIDADVASGGFRMERDNLRAKLAAAESALATAAARERERIALELDTQKDSGWPHMHKGGIKANLAAWVRAGALSIHDLAALAKPTKESVRAKLAKIAPGALFELTTEERPIYEEILREDARKPTAGRRLVCAGCGGYLENPQGAPFLMTKTHRVYHDYPCIHCGGNVYVEIAEPAS